MRALLLAAALLALGGCATAGEDAMGVHQPPVPSPAAPSRDRLAVEVTSTVPTTVAPTTSAARVGSPRRASRSSTRVSPPSGSGAPVAGGDVWAALARCESGGNPRAVSSSGKFRGAFQFSLSTWRGIGMSGDPIDHSYEVQMAAAQRLQARSGWGQWPQCARKLGLI